MGPMDNRITTYTDVMVNYFTNLLQAIAESINTINQDIHVVKVILSKDSHN